MICHKMQQEQGRRLSRGSAGKRPWMKRKRTSKHQENISSLVWPPGFLDPQKHSVGLFYCLGGIKIIFYKVLGLGTEEKQRLFPGNVIRSILSRSTRQSISKGSQIKLHETRFPTILSKAHWHEFPPHFYVKVS